MKRWDRVLAVLLCALLLTGAWSGLAETELEIEAPEELEEIGQELVPEDVELTADVLPEEVSGSGSEGLAPEEAIAGNPLPDEDREAGEAEVQPNDSDSDFDIDENGVLVKYRGDGGDVVIPNGVTRIGDNAFCDCYSLTSIVIPDGVTSIGMYAFGWCESLEEVSLPNSVTTIEFGAFEWDDSLKSITLPRCLETIEEQAFYGCDSLETITIPRSVTKISVMVFGGDSLRTINVAKGNRCFASKDGILYSYDMKAVLCCPSTKKNVVIPSGVTKIEEQAFYDCQKLKHVVIPYGVETLGDFAFGWCTKLDDVTLPSTVTSIASEAFYHNDSLSSITILSDKIDITKDAFEASSPTFHTVPGSDASDWAEKHGFDVVEDAMKTLVLKKDTIKEVAKGDSFTIDLNGAKAGSFTSSDTKIATVSKAGLVKVKGYGTAKITVELTTGKKLVLTLNSPYPTPTLSQTTLSLDIGKTAQLTVDDPAGRKVTWSSGNKKIATVKNGKVTAVKAGKCTVTALVKNGKKLTCKVTVTDPARLSRTSLELVMGKSATLSVSGLMGRTITWSSSKEKVATVTRGRVTALKAGKCTITATLSDGRKLKCSLTVTDPAELSRTSLKLLVGKSATLSVSGLEGRTVTWSSSDSKIATVDRGKVTAKKAGQCDIIARVGSVKLICAVTVEKPLTGDIHGILGKGRNTVNKRLPDKLRYFEDDAYTNDYFLVETDEDDDIISIALLTDAESGIGKYTLYGLYPGMDYVKACKLLSRAGWKLDSESYDKSYFYDPKDPDVFFYVTIEDDCVDLIVYMYK